MNDCIEMKQHVARHSSVICGAIEKAPARRRDEITVTAREWIFHIENEIASSMRTKRLIVMIVAHHCMSVAVLCLVCLDPRARVLVCVCMHQTWSCFLFFSWKMYAKWKRVRWVRLYCWTLSIHSIEYMRKIVWTCSYRHHPIWINLTLSFCAHILIFLWIILIFFNYGIHFIPRAWPVDMIYARTLYAYIFELVLFGHLCLCHAHRPLFPHHKCGSNDFGEI